MEKTVKLSMPSNCECHFYVNRGRGYAKERERNKTQSDNFQSDTHCRMAEYLRKIEKV
jgi:hypothetical protein